MRFYLLKLLASSKTVNFRPINRFRPCQKTHGTRRRVFFLRFINRGFTRANISARVWFTLKCRIVTNEMEHDSGCQCHLVICRIRFFFLSNYFSPSPLFSWFIPSVRLNAPNHGHQTLDSSSGGNLCETFLPDFHKYLYKETIHIPT